MPCRPRRAAAAFASALAMVLSFCAAASEVRFPPDRHAFLGLWEGINPLDGSTVQLSITDVEGDGVLDFVQREGFFTLCFQLGNNHSLGRGVITGHGTVVSGGVFDVEFSFTCIGDDTEPATLREGTFQYFLESRGRILLVPGVTSDTPDILLHRIAR